MLATFRDNVFRTDINRGDLVRLCQVYWDGAHLHQRGEVIKWPYDWPPLETTAILASVPLADLGVQLYP
jgi:hypothetical protein